jgi:hypothetical protein
MHKQLLGLMVLLFLPLASCGGSDRLESSTLQPNQPATPAPSDQGWPTALPQDGVQPWERAGSAINLDSEFAAGVERFDEGGTAGSVISEDGEALVISSGLAGNRDLGFAIYRLPLAGGELGALSVDANLATASTSYYVGLADYAVNHWRWFGPFSENAIRLGGGLIPAGDYTSELGNAFITVLTENGSAVDVIGVSVNPADSGDTAAAPVPGGLSVSAVDGALEAQWNSVIAADLAGYRVYFSSSSFSSPADAGVQSLPSLQSLTRVLVPAPGAGPLFVAVSSVDLSGNESALSTVVDGTISNPGAAQVLSVNVDAPSAMRGGLLTLSSSSGFDSYDLDLDGDGVYEESNASGSATLDTSAPGLIRANVRASSGETVAHGGISVIVLANTRPSCSATASDYDPGVAEDVTFTGTADDEEDPEASLDFSWDMDGDGIFEVASSNPVVTPFATPGLRNVKLRVTDTQGAWDVDTLAVNVSDSSNQSPVAHLSIGPTEIDAGEQAFLDPRDSFDPDGTIDTYFYDLDGNGSYETEGNGALQAFSFPASGIYEVGLFVVDNLMGVDSTSAIIRVHGWGSSRPTVSSSPSGRFCSMAEVQGRVAVAYFDQTQERLFYARSTGDPIKPWGDPESLAINMGPDNGYCSLAVIAGRPAVAYHDNATGQLHYVRAQEELGTDWAAPQLVDDGGGNDVGHWPSMLSIGGLPAIAYHDATAADLKYILAQDEFGIDWNISVLVEDSGSAGQFNSMALVNANPAIAYRDGSNSDLMYVRANDGTGSSWPSSSVSLDDFVSGVEPRVSLAVIDGFPAIAWEGGTFLEYRRANDADGAMWGGTTVVDNGGALASLCEHNGLPQIAYYHDFDNSLRVIGGVDGSFSSMAFSEIEIIGQIDAADYDSISLQLVDGELAVAFHDGDQNRLMYKQFVP